MVQDGDYFGRTVNLAARIAGRAGAGQVLVADEVVAAAEPDGARFEAVGPVRLKGSPDRSGFAWPYRPDVAAGWSAARARLASCAGHWRMRTPVGDNDTRRAACTVSA